MQPQVKAFFHAPTFTYTYVVSDGVNPACAVIDPVLDFDYKSGTTDTQSAEEVISFIKAQNLSLEWILETHAHADHISAAKYYQAQLGGKVAIGAEIHRVQEVFKGVFNYGDEFKTDGSQFDELLGANRQFKIGELEVNVLHTPGHTPACVSYDIAGHLFVGDTMFMPDVGTARCDFPGGDAEVLYASIQTLLSYPEDTPIYMCHDYPNDREACYLTTVAEQKAHNIHIGNGKSCQEFVAMRTARDASLEMPTLILPSIQINIRAGLIPDAENNGVSYLKLPLNQFK
ncbi:Glyoxylase, beta-lactamase superfamily II [Oceanospirillum multiglobuliferum]|uniref:MBL fold metallo-hydrolase n=1 Tax=Oceanospirillum multiglobuliferum TaxID=64969 RepID=A0A1T4MSI1_9GAMM|nr:MBL fold metallo-hydrolase [Oceanospirillum multiglobuliferum]OPX56914.1 MBL fold metallo-hydrolase [Oceanospirillum multiglobuliferum]SJZ69764.1 Glyoxylase, beta-lactamase superfamily II [Oceanospirillum multiglobuliferum]